MVTIIDGSGLLYRVQKALLRDEEVSYHKLIVGFMKLLLSFLILEKSKKIFVLFDWKGTVSAYRQGIYPEYKAHRHSTETETEKKAHKAALTFLISELPKLGFCTVCIGCVEADDIAFYLAHKYEKGLLLSRDNDWKLNLFPGWTLFIPFSDTAITYENFEGEWGPLPRLWYTYYKSLVGDTADGVPGVKGIGEKRARQFITDVRSGVSSKYMSKVIADFDVVERNLFLLSPEWILKDKVIQKEIEEAATNYVIPNNLQLSFNTFCGKIKKSGSELVMQFFNYECIMEGIE